MSTKREYRCTRCGRGEERGVTREQLVVKKVQFTTMGSGSSIIKSRVLEWLCTDCLQQDPDWQRQPFVAPGQGAQIA